MKECELVLLRAKYMDQLGAHNDDGSFYYFYVPILPIRPLDGQYSYQKRQKMSNISSNDEPRPFPLLSHGKFLVVDPSNKICSSQGLKSGPHRNDHGLRWLCSAPKLLE